MKVYDSVNASNASVHLYLCLCNYLMQKACSSFEGRTCLAYFKTGRGEKFESLYCPSKVSSYNRRHNGWLGSCVLPFSCISICVFRFHFRVGVFCFFLFTHQVSSLQNHHTYRRSPAITTGSHRIGRALTTFSIYS